ncbi:MAG: hypothetical protein ACJAUW_001781, partial [Yoonia sp.]
MWVPDFNVVIFECIPNKEQHFRGILVFAAVDPIDSEFYTE